MAIALGFRNFSDSYVKVHIVTDSLSVCSALYSPIVTPSQNNLDARTSISTRNPPGGFPRHRGIYLNETADYLAGVALSGHLVDSVPPISQVLASWFLLLA